MVRFADMVRPSGKTIDHDQRGVANFFGLKIFVFFLIEIGEQKPQKLNLKMYKNEPNLLLKKVLISC